MPELLIPAVLRRLGAKCHQRQTTEWPLSHLAETHQTPMLHLSTRDAGEIGMQTVHTAQSPRFKQKMTELPIPRLLRRPGTESHQRKSRTSSNTLAAPSPGRESSNTNVESQCERGRSNGNANGKPPRPHCETCNQFFTTDNLLLKHLTSAIHRTKLLKLKLP